MTDQQKQINALTTQLEELQSTLTELHGTAVGAHRGHATRRTTLAGKHADMAIKHYAKGNIPKGQEHEGHAKRYMQMASQSRSKAQALHHAGIERKAKEQIGAKVAARGAFHRAILGGG